MWARAPPRIRASVTARWRAATALWRPRWRRRTSSTPSSTAPTAPAQRVGWLTRWPVTREALAVVTPGEPDLLFVNFYNHVPNARRIASEAEVRCAGPRPMTSESRSCAGAAAAGRRIGRHRCRSATGRHAALAAFAGRVVDLDAPTRGCGWSSRPRRSTGSARGAALTDARRARAARRGARPGVDERELGDVVERAYVPAAAGRPTSTTSAATPMAAPAAERAGAVAVGRGRLRRRRRAHLRDQRVLLGLRRPGCCAPSPSAPSRRRSTASCTPWPTPPSTRSSRGCVPAPPRPSSSRPPRVIEDAGFTIRDDLVHGFVGGYLPPVLGVAQPAARAGARLHVRGRHDRRRAAQRRHARRARRRADGRAAARDRDGPRAAARRCRAGSSASADGPPRPYSWAPRCSWPSAKS